MTTPPLGPPQDPYPQGDPQQGYPQQTPYPQQGPYPQQTPYPQPDPYPQQGYPQQFGVPPQTPKRSNRKYFIIGGVALGLVLVLAVTGVVLLVKYASTSVTAAQVGDCIELTKASATDSDAKVTSCSSSAALYEVGERLKGTENCPSTKYTSFSLTKGEETATVLCLVPNFRQGSCYSVETLDKARYVNADCSGAQIKVDKRIDGQNDSSLCDADPHAIAIAYPEPKRTYCLVQP